MAESSEQEINSTEKANATEKISSSGKINSTEKAKSTRKGISKKDDAPATDPLTLVEAPTSDPIPVVKSTTKQSLPDPFPYRHYYALYPTCNKMLASKWDAAQRHRHLKKLAAAKPNVDNTAPKVYNHLKVKLKKIQMEEDRQAQIQRLNRVLLEKMSHIVKMEGKDPNIHADRGYGHPRNYARRRKELQKINSENKAMLQRLEESKPLYNHNIWDKDRLQNLNYLKNISSYPGRFIEQKKEYELRFRKGETSSKSKKETNLPRIENKPMVAGNS
jgi:E3 ubiquitin-protein ligase TRIP12